MKREPAIAVRGLNFAYPDSAPILTDINFSIFNGDTVGIIGPNGAGKSTLLLHLNGILRGNGDVCVDSEPIRKNTLNSIRKKVGIVFQDPNDVLFMPSIFDDIAFGLLNQGMKETEVACRVNRMLQTLSLEKNKHKPAHLLSLGERKKASLATVLVMEPDVTILDEPTVCLDPGTRRELINLIQQIRGTIIIASHDMDMIFQLCTHAILLNNGRLIAHGESAEILGDESLLKEHNLDVPAVLRYRCIRP